MFKYLLFHFFLIFSILYGAGKTKCDVYIDHTPIVVNNLESTTLKYKNMGFIIKPGYLHDNGILNNHIKFKNSTEIEIISLSKIEDKISKSYLKFLEHGEGGTFLALRINSIDSTIKILESNNFQYNIQKSKFFTYITFLDTDGLNHIFFINYAYDFTPKSTFVNHKNNTNGIEQVWLEGNEQTIVLFQILGCKTSCSGSNVVVNTENGQLFIVKPKKKTFYRVLGVQLNSPSQHKQQYNISGFNLNY